MSWGWGAAIIAIGCVGIHLSAKRDLKSAEQYPDRWNVPLQRRIVDVTRYGAIAIGIAASLVVAWSVLQSS